MPFGFHWYDLLVLFGLALLIFGPKRLPEMGASVGKTIKEFQKSMREAREPEPTQAVPPASTQAAPELPSASTASAANAASTSPAETPKE